jgi:HD-GYP domain-containing protein (c-di-GMP phosphodiesterase class II)
MLKSIQGSFGKMLRACCKYHHEWFNGEGYWGKFTNELPQYVSFVAIADVFTALISKRSYKNAWPPNEAIEYIQNKAGTQFCPELVKMFLSLVHEDRSVPALLFGGQSHD